MRPRIEASLYPNLAINETVLTIRPEKEVETLIDIFDNSGKHYGSLAKKLFSLEAINFILIRSHCLLAVTTYVSYQAESHKR